MGANRAPLLSAERLARMVLSPPPMQPAHSPAWTSGRLRSIDLMRGAAALAVVVYHSINAGSTPPASATWYPWLSELAEFGQMGVPLFFVLSGFCIHFGWARAHSRGEDDHLAFLPFWRRRLHRLYPPYLVALVLSIGLALAVSFVRPDLALRGYPTPDRGWLGLDLLAHAAMVHGFIPFFDRAGGNPPFWTLAREEYFYLMYFGLLAARRRLGPLRAVLGVGVVGLLFPFCFRPFLAESSPWWDLINSSSIALWLQWALGFLAVEAFFGLVRLPALASDLRLVPLWMAAAIACKSFAPVALAPICWGLAFFTLVNGLVARERAGRGFEGGWARWLAQAGVYSYSIYLVHHPVRGLVKRALEGWIVNGEVATFVVANVAVVAAGYGAGRLFFELVERRFLRTAAVPEAPQVPEATTVQRSSAPG